ncbi:AAA family ATPase, partial [Marinospirillum sp.]|uniref:AAA family ATPase n=1 Tax=Marinospirillum sp. TaxID=2183934 RepID=UPI0025BAACEC
MDKTPHIHRLVDEGKYYFLSRPRRFGKSLLLDTIDCLFAGRQPLFEGLFILTLDTRFTTICGYTDADLDEVFAPELPGLDRAEIKHWYNGYRWGGEETSSVYNPFDVLLLLQKRVFEPYWFETATPTFLVNLLQARGVFTPELAAWHTRPALLNQFDVDAISTDALLFQSGYLTLNEVHSEVPNRPLYRLGFPNQEVSVSLNEVLLPILGVKDAVIDQFMLRLPRILRNADMAGLETHLKALFAGLPHDWYRNNPIAQYEGHYASVFYSHFAALGVRVTVEDASNYGKVDMSVEFDGHLYLFEFKVVEQLPEGSALQQI